MTKRYAIYYQDQKTAIIVESEDDGATWERFQQAGDNIGLLVNALNAWHDEETAVTQLAAEIPDTLEKRQ